MQRFVYFTSEAACILQEKGRFTFVFRKRVFNLSYLELLNKSYTVSFNVGPPYQAELTNKYA